MKVKDIMTREVETCSESTSLTSVANEMWEAGCGAMPVVGANGRVVGIITDRDISMALVTTVRSRHSSLSTSNRKPANVAAGEAMSRYVHSCGPDDEVKKALETMQTYHVRRLPVVSETERWRSTEIDGV